MSDAKDPWTWVDFAERDLQVAKLVVDSATWSIVCYHAQQCAEKMLKALIVSREQVPAKTHDLIALLKECVQLGYPISALLEDCKFLLRYAASNRYPGAAYDPDEGSAREAIAAAKRVSSAVRPLLPPAAS